MRRRQSSNLVRTPYSFWSAALLHAGSLEAGARRFWLQRPQRCRSKGSWNLANCQRDVSINSCLPVLHHDPECDRRQPNASRAFAQSGLCGTPLTYRDILASVNASTFSRTYMFLRGDVLKLTGFTIAELMCHTLHILSASCVDCRPMTEGRYRKNASF